MPSKAHETVARIAKIFVLSFEEIAGGYICKIGNSVTLEVTNKELLEVADQIERYQSMDGLAVADKRSYEVLVEASRETVYVRHFLRNGFTLEDHQQGIKYQIDYPSLAYLIHTLEKLPDQGKNAAKAVGVLHPVRMLERRAELESAHLFDLLRTANRLFSLRIISEKDRPASYWTRMAEAVYFHLGYNIDVAFMPLAGIDELTRNAAISRVRRTHPSELDAPHRHYIRDLVHHYQLGVSAESPMLEYISYYHVAEHWFETIYQEDLVEQVQSRITAPDFSYKRKQDVQGLIRAVSKAVQVRSEELVINEQFALKLTLEKHVDIAQLRADINTFNPSLLNHYATNAVKFSNGDKVQLTGADEATIFGALSKRIYKTRNSLVHSKDGAKSRFVPFTDDAHLLPEIPLMRFVAEQIIVSTSTAHS